MDTSHLPPLQDMSAEALAEAYPPKTKLMCRLLWVNPEAKMVGLTLRPELLRHTLGSFQAAHGDVLEKCVVIRHDTGLGLLLKTPAGEVCAALTGRLGGCRVSGGVSDEFSLNAHFFVFFSSRLDLVTYRISQTHMWRSSVNVTKWGAGTPLV